jgi:deoxyribodipyrimidine photo-lyase
MMESLHDLDKQIRSRGSGLSLWVAYGDEVPTLKKIYSKIRFDAVYVNEDFTPYAIKRDKSIKQFCSFKDILFSSHTDILLVDSTLDIRAQNSNTYGIFSQFYRTALTYPIRKPKHNPLSNFKSLVPIFAKWKVKTIDSFLLKKEFYTLNEQIAIHGGRTRGLRILSHVDKFKTYKKTHDMLALNTTRLSPHNKFGTVSIREVYWSFKLKAKSVDLCRQLYWRDFYYYVGIHFGKDLYAHNHLKLESKDRIQWENKKSYLTAWQVGLTGFPIVDAAMAEINATGFMHNRGRLITSSFLTKDLLIDWKHGEKYFSQRLIDIDRAQNIGNWNWSASFGLDSTPFLRVLNPWTQSKKYDPKASYIKKWLPMLADVEPKHLHRWNKYHELYDVAYPAPIVDHDVRRKIFLKYYKTNFS